MRRLLALVLLLQALHVELAQAAHHPLLELVVSAPFLEMHSGPGRGFPVVYVVGRDEVLTVLYSRTDWYKVRAAHGEEGWARREDLVRTKLPSGEPAPIPPYPEFSTHRWEIGAGYGVYNRQNLVTAYVDYGITDSIDIEVVLQQAFGTLDNRIIGIDRPAPYVHPGVEVVLAHRRHRHRLPAHQGEGAAGAAREQQPDGLCVARSPRIHHPTIHVARRLAPLRRLQQPECL